MALFNWFFRAKPELAPEPVLVPPEPLAPPSGPAPDFDKAFDELMAVEGGYVDDPNDPGGETNWGISKRSYPELDIKNLTKDQARQIYETKYWIPYRCGELKSQELAEELFKAVVNMPGARAIGCFQAAIVECERRPAVEIDSVIGDKTIAAANAIDPQMLQYAFELELIRYYASLKQFNLYGKGWVHRVMDS